MPSTDHPLVSSCRFCSSKPSDGPSQSHPPVERQDGAQRLRRFCTFLSPSASVTRKSHLGIDFAEIILNVESQFVSSEPVGRKLTSSRIQLRRIKYTTFTPLPAKMSRGRHGFGPFISHFHATLTSLKPFNDPFTKGKPHFLVPAQHSCQVQHETQVVTGNASLGKMPHCFCCLTFARPIALASSCLSRRR